MPARLILLVAAFFLFVAAPAPAQQREAINAYDARVEVQQSGDILVTEEIEVTALGQEIRRGIFRDLPLGGFGLVGIGRAGFELIEAERDGAPEASNVERTAEGVRIYLGQADVMLEPGPHRYRIVYRVTDQIDHYDEFDEIYWNATGNAWAFPIEQARVTVVPPPGAAPSRTAVYTGRVGETGAAATLEQDADGNPVFVANAPLAPGEGITVAVGWPKGHVADLSGRAAVYRWLERHGALALSGLTVAVLLAYYLAVWARVGRDPERGPVIPIYHPELPPEAMRYIERMGADRTGLVAAILSLAVKGRLTIADEGGTQRLTKTEPAAGAAPTSAGEEAVARALFAAGPQVTIAEGDASRLGAASMALDRHLDKTFNRVYFNRNLLYFGLGALITLVGWGLAALLSAEYLVGLFACLFLAVWTVAAGAAGLAALRAFGRGDIGRALALSIFAVPALLVALGVASVLAAVLGPAPVLLLLAGTGINILFFQLLKAPTAVGAKALDEIEGTRLYLTVAEADRLRFHNPPDRTPEHFHELLPYALALGVETDWTDQFRDAIEQARLAGREDDYLAPSWYRGRRLGNGGFGRLGRDMSRAVAAATAPKSSGGGRSGGSGGGGFSGGGRGGGGGGGW